MNFITFITEEQMETLLNDRGYNIYCENEMIDSTKVIDIAVSLGYSVYRLDGEGQLQDNYVFINHEKKLEDFKQEIMSVINKYGEEHIDIAIEGNIVYGFYHSDCDSFNVTQDYTLSSLKGIGEIEEIIKDFDKVCINEWD